jgi:signal transduction histidine kinase
LQQLAPATPIIVLTGLVDEEMALEAIARGAADYLIKGQAPAALLERSLLYSIERKKNENGRVELARANAFRVEAESANRAKDEFLATISHELRTPLNAIMGWASLLKGNNLDEATQLQAIEIIERNARVQAQLIEDLLDVSRIIAGNLRLEYAEINISQLARSAVETLSPTADAKSIKCHLEIEAVPDMCGDPTRLQQVAWNLISNAIKFTPEGGHITVRTCLHGEHIGFEVIDSGVGIAPEFLPHVFERFRQADGSTTRRFGGLGLGLAIVRHIVGTSRRHHHRSQRRRRNRNTLRSEFARALKLNGR